LDLPNQLEHIKANNEPKSIINIRKISQSGFKTSIFVIGAL